MPCSSLVRLGGRPTPVPVNRGQKPRERQLLQQFPHFGRVYAAYGGVFVVLSVVWGWGIDGMRPDRWDVAGSLVCLVGVGIILYGPRTVAV